MTLHVASRYATVQMHDVTSGFGIRADIISGASRCTRHKFLALQTFLILQIRIAALLLFLISNAGIVVNALTMH